MGLFGINNEGSEMFLSTRSSLAVNPKRTSIYLEEHPADLDQLGVAGSDWSIEGEENPAAGAGLFCF